MIINTEKDGAVIGERLKKLREELGLTQVALAEISFISNTHICRLEANKIGNEIRTSSLYRLADALGTSVAYLLGREDDPGHPELGLGPKAKWFDNSVQFPRLLSEILSVMSISEEDWTALSESMNLDIPEINELFNRACREWETIKENVFNEGNKRK